MISRYKKVSKYIEPKLWNWKNGAPIQMLVLLILNFFDAGIKAISPFILFEGIKSMLDYNDAHPENNPNEDEIQPLLILSGFVLAWSFGQLIPNIRKILTTDIKAKLSNKLTTEIVQASIEMPLALHQTNPPGFVMQLIHNTYMIGSNYVPSIYQTMIPALLETVGTSAIIGTFATWKVALAALGAPSAFAIVSYLSTLSMPELEKQRAASQEKLAGALSEIVANYESIHYFNNEGFELDRVREMLSAHKIKAIASINITNRSELLRNFSLAITYLAITGFAAHQYMATDELDYNNFIILVMYLIQLSVPLNSLAGTINQFNGALAELESCIDFLNRVTQIQELPGLPDLIINNNEEPEIRFQNVSLSPASGKKKKRLDDVNFTIRGGSTVALVGMSGSGKTTIGNLLFRFIEPDEGRIFINNQDISTCNMKSVREAIGIVSQHPVLFNTSLRKNVHYGNLAIEDENSQLILNALHTAGLKSDLDDGSLTLDQNVGEGGSQLSGGQKQRIATARMLLKDAPIIFLDEATSGLDIENRISVMQTLREITYGFTTIIVTHELSLTVNADQILVFHKGKMVEQGTFDELVNVESAKQKEKETDNSKRGAETGRFYRMFQLYCNQLGQPVSEVARNIPRITPEKKRQRGLGFFERAEVQLVSNATNDNERTPLNKKIDKSSYA